LEPDEFSRIGAVLFARSGWFMPLGEALNINTRTIRAWAAGRDPIPRDISRRLIEVAHARRNEIAEEVLERLLGDDD
jgi:hypothetical protein